MEWVWGMTDTKEKTTTQVEEDLLIENIDVDHNVEDLNT